MSLNSPKGNISQMTLDDGSTIWLNSGSEILVKKYGKERIDVDLKGEAFFDVQHNPDREFIVTVGDYVVHDVGTQFNVDYQTHRHRLKVALFEGAIDFRKGDCSLNSDLQAGKMICYTLKSQTMMIEEADKEYITAWKDGKFIFVNRTMGDITRELEEWYDVHFVFRNEKIKDQVFSGVIKRKTSLEHLLRVLRLSAEIDYEIKENKDGTFTVIFK
jgi:transmembrane sensor